MNKQQLAGKIWQSANKMRSKIEANEYKDYILGFIFYKFLSEKEEKYLKDNDWEDEYMSELTEDDEETVESIRKNLGYFIAYNNLFSTWIKSGDDFTVQNVSDALSAFNRLINPSYQAVFEGVFDTLQTGLSKLGDTTASRTNAIRNLVHLIDDIPMNGQEDYDVLGFVYEYLIGMFAANAGKKAGEFYTPHEVSLLMSEIIAGCLKERDKIEIYDSCSGSGSLLINIGRSTSKYINSNNNIKYYAQELKKNTYNLTRMNLVMRGILPANIVTRNADTLEDDWPLKNKDEEPLRLDAVVSNPPYSQEWAPREKDPRFTEYGMPPTTKADYAFLLHDLYHLKNDGIMTIVLPHGVLFRGEESDIRKNLIEKNNIDAIIGLPPKIFFGTGIPTIIMVLKKSRTITDTLIIDASKGYEKDGKNNKLRSSDIKRIVDAYENRKTIPKFSKVVDRDEIRKNEYNLNLSRYVDSSEDAESWDIYSSMFGGFPQKDIDKLEKYWIEFPGLKELLFEFDEKGTYKLKVNSIKETILNNKEIFDYKKRFSNKFSYFYEYLFKNLIEEMSILIVSKKESEIADNMFDRLSSESLVDKYEAYQLLDDEWNKIAIDLEIIQSEGVDSIKQVDPRMVLEKDGKEEVQDGWVGHILPFELVQDELLKEDKLTLKKKEERLVEISSEIEELFDSLTEEEKEKEFAGEKGFVNAELKKAIKSKNYGADTISKLQKVESLNSEEKLLKKSIKTESESLIIKTKNTIENLSNEQAVELLSKKWIRPVINGINSLPDKVVSVLISEIEKIEKKYETTFEEITNEIESVEMELSRMLKELKCDERDNEGIKEFIKLLGGEMNG